MLWWWAGRAWAESWCAVPLEVHEWGVQVLRADGARPEVPPLPSWFHRSGIGAPTGLAAVHTLPADSGCRALPVVQFYSSRSFGDNVPVGLEVGFAQGTASVWFPAVDVLRPPARGLPPQLDWDALVAQPTAPDRLNPAEQGWVESLRAMPEALWVSRGSEADRFLFYEGTTRETPAVRVTRSGQGLVIENLVDWYVHDVVIQENGRVAFLPALPPRQKATVTLQTRDPDALLAQLRERWVDAAEPAHTEFRWNIEDCRMMRDPAEPVQRSEGHRLYAGEVAVLMNVWAERLVGDGPLQVVYREDIAALDSLVPLSVYTDMYHYVEMRRLGLVLVEGL